MADTTIGELLLAARGRCLVVVDEAYAEFCNAASWATRLVEHPHLVVLRTLSKAHGLAGSRIGSVIAAPELIALLRKLVPPYAITTSSAREALQALDPAVLTITCARLSELLRERQRLAAGLARAAAVRRVWPSDANFVLIEVGDAAAVAAKLRAGGLLVRDFSGKGGLANALRITVGTAEQNDRVLAIISGSIA